MGEVLRFGSARHQRRACGSVSPGVNEPRDADRPTKREKRRSGVAREHAYPIRSPFLIWRLTDPKTVPRASAVPNQSRVRDRRVAA